VLLDEDGQPCGTATKAEVHHEHTPLHLAFSCWLLDAGDELRVLLTQRAGSKLTWPLIWTNSFCGHPAPGEEMTDAIHRRAAAELGAKVRDIEVVLPDFRYTARMSNGIVENEICPVHLGVLVGDLDPDPEEVEAFRWIEWRAFRKQIDETPEKFSPWLLDQLPQLEPILAERFPDLLG
jgi:isopentenyl-diphosphate delta-isomerase